MRRITGHGLHKSALIGSRVNNYKTRDSKRKAVSASSIEAQGGEEFLSAKWAQLLATFHTCDHQ